MIPTILLLRFDDRVDIPFLVVIHVVQQAAVQYRLLLVEAHNDTQ